MQNGPVLLPSRIVKIDRDQALYDNQALPEASSRFCQVARIHL